MYATAGNAALKQYQQVGAEGQVADADGHRLVMLLFEGALERINAARAALEAGNLARKGELIGKAVTILGGLRETLDFEAGGEVAENLDRLYDYMQRRLLEAHVKNRPELMQEVAGLLRPLAEAWAAMPEEARRMPLPNDRI
ncbi:flagellar protein FliS [Methylomarinovum caldicuralii]|uniref:Flagellar secretion chaperone FliS n=1 Tax=Methylomarinovum caldicuralii TaxID=438856 RepID=A0AAU9BZ92_9GAMM|nr:flagellar export chaperone FliS [Methylomarinovum caldicuralii]BCX81407.1 flagellar protein FliS [Methylomarinovum caldicuralii]